LNQDITFQYQTIIDMMRCIGCMHRWAMVRQLARVMWLRRKRLLAAWTGAARDMSMRAEIARREAEVWLMPSVCVCLPMQMSCMSSKQHLSCL
jgi:hypothetical protein